jgi:hypothetical protein
MNKKDLAVLERMFADEVDGKHMTQTESKRMESLEAQGMVERLTITYPGRFPVVAHGWILTHLGRFTYCKTCQGEEA